MVSDQLENEPANQVGVGLTQIPELYVPPKARTHNRHSSLLQRKSYCHMSKGGYHKKMSRIGTAIKGPRGGWHILTPYPVTRGMVAKVVGH